MPFSQRLRRPPLSRRPHGGSVLIELRHPLGSGSDGSGPIMCLRGASERCRPKRRPKAPPPPSDCAGGKTVYLTTTESSDVLFEALRFCAEHLPSLELDECARNLVAAEA